MSTPRSPHPGADLRLVLALGREVGDHLLTAGERVVLARIDALWEEPLELLARMVRRKGPIFRRSDLDYALDVSSSLAGLEELELLSTVASDAERLAAVTADALRLACRTSNLPSTGRRAELEARLRGRSWRGLPELGERVWRVASPGLLARMEALAFPDSWLDADVLVVERLGRVTWPRYTPTGGGQLPDRRCLRLWERALTGQLESLGEAILALDVLPVGDRGRRRAAQFVMEHTDSEEGLECLNTRRFPVTAAWARRLEEQGRHAEALKVCLEGRGFRADRPAIDRVARRVAKALGASWQSAGLVEPAVRYVTLPTGAREARQLWKVDLDEYVVEHACAARLRELGRRAIHGENWFWTTLFALVFRDIYWLPVAGQLPHARLHGPRDLGTESFYLNRKEACDRRLSALAELGPAPFLSGWDGEWLGGMSRVEEVLPVIHELGAAMCCAVLERLCKEGWSAARGLPDLVVLAGPPGRLPDAVPPSLPEFAFLCEVKAPGDTRSDAQRVWHDHLVVRGIHVELWVVRPESMRQ